MRDLLIELILALGISLLTITDGSEQFFECPTPVVEYTTGGDDTNLYQVPGWAVIDVVPHAPSGDAVEGFIVLIEPFGEDDERFNGFTSDQFEPSKLHTGDTWILQQDFEYVLCQTNM